MPSLQDLKARFEILKSEVVKKLPDIAATLAVSAKALAERNIKGAGFGALYSLNRIPSWYLDGKELNASGPAYLKAKNKKDQLQTHTQDGVKYFPADYGVTWKEFRDAQGLQTQFVDLTYTGFMFSNMQPVKFQQNSDGTVVRAFLGGTNVETQKKMDYNRDRYGDFVRKAITPENDQQLKQVVADELNLVLQQFKP